MVILFSSPLLQSPQTYAQSNQSGSSNTCAGLPAKGITASGAETLNPPSKAIDQNVNTRWSNLGLGSWIQIDLGQENIICSVGINWHRGDERVNSFVISISNDGKTFTSVLSGKSDGTSLAEQNYNLQSKTGRFIRVMVNGNTQNDWVSIAELKIYGYKPISESCVSSPVLKVTGPSSQDAYQPSNVIDNNLNTVWSNYGVGSSIVLDLGSSKTVCSVDIAWYKGNERQNNFVISTSVDGSSYKNVLDTKSSVSTLSYETYVIPNIIARYVKITVNGNTQNNYASINEIKIQSDSSGSTLPPSLCTINLPLSGVTASGNDGNVPANVLDNNLATRWSSFGIGQFITVDLGSTKNICSVGIAWYKGNERVYSFVIATSTDGTTFTNKLSGSSSGTTSNSQKYSIPSTDARYVRITVNGNTANNWASMKEVDIFGPGSSPPPPSDCTANLPISSATASANDGNVPSNVLDNNLATRWSSFGIGQFITVDLGSTKDICSVGIAWYKGSERENNFVISASNDGVSFSNVFSGMSSGSTVNLEKYNVGDTNARYIRITVNGNDQNNWASMTEISVHVVKPFSIGAAGDWGSSRNDNWKKTVQLMIDNNVELSLGLGDYSYGTLSEFRPVVDALKKAGIPMKGGKGDHDSDSYAGLFGQPSMTYAFDAGPARIILIDSYKSPSSNAAFLEKELMATKQPWKIVVTTTPLYTSPSRHDADGDQTRALQPLFDKYKVDLVMWGDNHNYERIQLPNKSTVFIQSGTAGRSHYAFEGRMAGSIYQNDNDYGITKLIFSGNALTGEFITHGGKVLDSFKITK